MITNVSLVTVYVTDQDAAKAWYCDHLGFVEHTDVTMGDDFRWVTISHPSQPELELTLMKPGPPLDAEMADVIRRALAAGNMGGFGINSDDCHADYERLTAAGVTFVQPPSDRPYGIEAVLRDNSGNWLVMVESRPFDGSDFAHPQP